MKDFTKIIFIWILLFNCSIVHSQSFKKDWEWLKFAEKALGTTNSAYENALLDLIGNNLKDTLMVPYYDSIAIRLYNIIPQIEKNYGITSVQYWNLVDACGALLTINSTNNVKLKKEKSIVKFLKSLEKIYPQAEENEYVFITGLSDVYRYLGDKNKALFWGQKRLDFAKKTRNSSELAGAYCLLADILVKYNNEDKLESFLNELVSDPVITYQDKHNVVNYILNNSYETISDRNKSDMAICLLKFEDKGFLNLQALCHKASEFQDYFIFDVIENSDSFRDLSLEDKFNYYKWNATGFSIYNNPKRSVDYLLNAILLAQNNNRDDLNWHYHGSEATEKTHNWLWLSYYYEYELSDKENALLYSEKNLAATKDYYGEYSTNYYRELRTLSNKYDLWHNDIAKVTVYDSIATVISKNVYGINSEEHVTSFLSYISCLRRKNDYRKALSLCEDYLSNADSTNVYLHMIYNQAAMCSYSLGMQENALSLFYKAINNTDDDIEKSLYTQNLSALLVEGRDISSALELLEKHQPRTRNPRDIYNFLNTKANILANIDSEKAYSTFCNAEQYESDRSVQLIVDRQLNHYMDKAKVAPDLHLKFSALQQALKIFDNNSTADSLIYARIIADIADYYNAVMNVDKAIELYSHAVDVYFRNSKDISVPLLDFCDRAILFELSHRFDSQLVSLAEWSLEMRKQLQGETNIMYILHKLELLDKFSRFGYESKADSLANEIMSAQLPSDIEHERDYYLGVYEQHSRKDLKKAAYHYEKFLLTPNSVDLSLGVYGDLMKIYKELGEYTKYDNAENKFISMWYQDVESKWYHITDQERKNFLSLLKGWHIYLAKYACTPISIENAVNASLFCKGRLTQTTKAINEELSRLGKHIPVSDVSQSPEAETKDGIPNDIILSDYIISSQDSINRNIVYNDLSTKKLEKLVNSNISQVKKALLKEDVGIDFINIDASTVLAYIIKKDKPTELISLPLTDSIGTFEYESLENLSLSIKGAKRVFFSPSENMSIRPIESFFISRFPKVEVHRVLSLSNIHKVNNINIKNAVAIGNPRFNDMQSPKSSQNRGTFWQPLPGTKIEIDSISSMLRSNNVKINAYTENNATETVVKELSRKNIDLIHIATHGFFNSENNESGLLFTGANRSLNGESTNSIDDGILTCEEIENLYFPSLKLVVLSACETGLGESNIDGVWGLQRAFRIAGAQNMIVSLKKVDDDLTQAFMIRFYKNLTLGKTIYNSFWEAMDNADEDTRNSFILIE